MVPFGIGMAATIRVGHAVGANDAAAVKRAGVVAMLLGVVLSTILTLAVVLARVTIVRSFLGATSENADVTINLAATLLAIGATLFIPDGLQGTAVGALRGLKDTRVPLLFAAISYWLIGFSAAYALAFFTPLGPLGVWIGLSLGTVVHATLLTLRFHRLADRFVQA
jgi:MATE family multidrug resistance protein